MADPMFRKTVLAIDIDEVLGHFIPLFAEFYNSRMGTSLTSDSFHSYSFHLVTGGTEQEMHAHVADFAVSDSFINQTVLPGAFEALLKLADHYELHVITSRPLAWHETTVSFIQRNFPGLFTPDRIHSANHYAKEGKKREKSEICKEVAAKYLVDDNLMYARDAAVNGIEAFLFGEYAWNRPQPQFQDVEEHPLVKRVSGWDEIVDYLIPISQERHQIPIQ